VNSRERSERDFLSAATGSARAKRGPSPARAAVLFVLAVAAACTKPGSAPADASTDGTAHVSFDANAVARAEDARRAKDVAPELRTSHDVAARRRTARALARIADAASVEPLSFHLADEDHETVAWAAYGLGYACRGREDTYVKTLSARAASLPAAAEARRVAGARGASEIDPWIAIGRAIGRCGGPSAEQALLALLRVRGAWDDAALLGFGDLATRRKALGADAMTALVEAVSGKDASRDLAFYALSRAEPGDAFGRRVMEVARLALSRPSDARILAIKTFARAGKGAPKDAAPELARVVSDKKFTAGERAEAARGLSGLGPDGQASAADAVVALTPDLKDPMAIAALGGTEFHVLYTTLAALSPEPPKRVEPLLQALSSLAAPTEPKVGVARRLAELRCAAALALARGAYDSAVLKKCDAETSEVSQRARLASLLRRKVEGERRNVFRTFAKSDHLRIREEAVEAIAGHPEIGGEIVAAIIADALGSKHAGLVATAAEFLHAHPERATVLAESEKRAALDPRAPPPTTNPAQEMPPVVTKALAAALAGKWPEDRVETRIALFEAAGTLRMPQAKGALEKACNDPNVTVRERALLALRAHGETVTACNAPDRGIDPAAEIGKTIARPTKVVFAIDGAEFAIVLEPELSPVTATRIMTLAKTGFFKGILVHRVVPGFVVQFGDPEGDGYGGSGTSLRCETAPVPFNAFDVGMALAGRDTGSSQLFVTLSRTPHLDGEYTRVGKAEGDWAQIAQGDVIADARVVE